jgi:serine/threonine-protein kinase
MGTVYEAVHESLGHRVAIKLLHERLAREPDITKRFENEARAAAIIRHPGIVSVFEFATGATGQAYLVMEYLDGESLGARITKKGKLPVPEVLKLGRQVASILLAAHKKGVIHRDIKPDNIFLTLDPEMEGGSASSSSTSESPRSTRWLRRDSRLPPRP